MVHPLNGSVAAYLWDMAKFSALLVVVLELAFRLLPATSFPDLVFDSKYNIIRFDTTGKTGGVYTYGRLAEIRGRWAVNNDGWNSSTDYLPVEQRTKPLVVLIGDSYLENFYLDGEHHLGAELARRSDQRFDVYELGRSGMTLAEYILMVEYAYDRYRPDYLVFLVNADDLSESIRSLGTRSKWTQIENIGQDTYKILPGSYVPSDLKKALRKSAFFRYLNSQFLLSPNPPAFDFAMHPKRPRPAQIDTVALLRNGAHWILDSLQAQQRRIDIPMLFALHPDRESIYRDPTATAIPLSRELSIIRDDIRQRNQENTFNFLNLTDGFVSAYRRDSRRFEFEINPHWNAYGNETAAAALYQQLESSPDLER